MFTVRGASEATELQAHTHFHAKVCACMAEQIQKLILPQLSLRLPGPPPLITPLPPQPPYAPVSLFFPPPIFTRSRPV